MEITTRQAKREDAQQMLQVYNNFAKQFVGTALRAAKSFTRMLRKKDNVNWVALDSQNRIVGYVHARLNKRINRGEFAEIVVDPKYDFEKIARPLVERVNAAFLEKKVSAIVAGSIRNPEYEKLFPTLGFFESESMGVFMYAILDVQKFLNEVSPVLISRLKQLKNWDGLGQIECEGHSLFLQKIGENVQSIVWTNQPVNLKFTLTRELITKLIFGIANPEQLYRDGQVKVETTGSLEKAKLVLSVLFPGSQFLLMDDW